jgi:glycosyltransferase involved in cell wall biosynthesis
MPAVKMPNNQNNKRIKIAYIMPTLDRGGAERFLTDLILNLDRHLYEPTLILFKRGGDWTAELVAENIPVIILEKKRPWDIKNFRQLFLALKKIRPQIVHTQLGGDLYGRLAAKILRIPVIVSTEQNVNPDEGQLKRRLKIITSRYANKIVAISSAVKNDLIKRYRTPPDKIIVIYNGLEINRFLTEGSAKPVKSAGRIEPDARIIIGTIGRLEPQKGQSVLIKAGQGIDLPDWSCLIAGTGSLEKELTDKINRLGLSQKIKLIGPTADPSRFLKKLDIFVLPSLWEGLGIVLLEAGLSGLPIIASEVDGITEIIDETTGWLVPAGDSGELARQINWLGVNLDSPAVRKKSERLKEKIIRHFSITTITRQYSDLYQALLEQKNK